MGMMINGQWTVQDTVIQKGAFQRATSSFRERDTSIAHEIARRPATFWLIGSHSCPWSHRALLLCAVKNLPLRLHRAFGPRTQGYSLNGGVPWSLPGLPEPIVHLHQIYSSQNPTYTGRATVPLLWDAHERRIVSNESAEIFAILDAVEDDSCLPFTLRPKKLLPEIEAANAFVYEGLNNAVYRAGFAAKQSAYDSAVAEVFETLDFLEQRLSNSRYYFSNILTETDLRIFPTLVRFDAVYAVLFKCSLRRLTDYPHLWSYARDLFSFRGVRATIDFEQIRTASYLADTRDPSPIIAVAPDANWFARNNRADFGLAEVITRTGAVQPVNITTLAPIK